MLVTMAMLVTVTVLMVMMMLVTMLVVFVAMLVLFLFLHVHSIDSFFIVLRCKVNRNYLQSGCRKQTTSKKTETDNRYNSKQKQIREL